MQHTFSNADIQHRAVHRLPIEFTGSDSEYLRTGIVNLLLMFVTFDLYCPKAKPVIYVMLKKADREAVRTAYFRRDTRNMQATP